MTAERYQSRSASPARLIACLDAVPLAYANPWLSLINASMEQAGLSWRQVAEAVASSAASYPQQIAGLGSEQAL